MPTFSSLCDPPSSSIFTSMVMDYFVNVAVACVRWSQKCFGDGLIYMLCCIASSMKLTEHHKRSSVSPTTARYDSNKFV